MITAKSQLRPSIFLRRTHLRRTADGICNAATVDLVAVSKAEVFKTDWASG